MSSNASSNSANSSATNPNPTPQTQTATRAPDPTPSTPSSQAIPSRMASLRLDTSVQTSHSSSVVFSPISPSVPWPLHFSAFRKLFGLPRTYKYQSYLHELEDGKWAVFEDGDEVEAGNNDKVGNKRSGEAEAGKDSVD